MTNETSVSCNAREEMARPAPGAASLLFSSKSTSLAALHWQVLHDSHPATMGSLLQNLSRDSEGFSEHLRLRSGQLSIDITYESWLRMSRTRC